MQRYEYMLVNCSSDAVTTVNGVRVGRLGEEPRYGEYIWDYLTRWGSEGWEVVTATSDQYNRNITYTLKRLI